MPIAENLALVLTGSVTVQTPVLERGQMQHCTETVTNRGIHTVSAQPLRHLVVSITAQQLVTSQDTAVALAAGGSQTMAYTMATSGWAAGDYACVLQTQVASAWQTLATGPFTVQVPSLKIDAALHVGARSRVLVLLDPPTAPCHGDDDDMAFVTLEPCSFYGRTPSCAVALSARNIAQVAVPC